MLFVCRSLDPSWNGAWSGRHMLTVRGPLHWPMNSTWHLQMSSFSTGQWFPTSRVPRLYRESLWYPTLAHSTLHPTLNPCDNYQVLQAQGCKGTEFSRHFSMEQLMFSGDSLGSNARVPCFCKAGVETRPSTALFEAHVSWGITGLIDGPWGKCWGLPRDDDGSVQWVFTCKVVPLR